MRQAIRILALTAFAGGGLAAAQDSAIHCEIRYMEPQLDFEFRFFTGFTAAIPARQLIGPARRSVTRVTVTPLTREASEPVRLSNRIDSGPIPDHVRGDANLRGSFVVGVGRYHVRWEFQDSLDHYCAVEWEVEAKLPRKQKNLEVSMAPGEVGDSRLYLFRSEESVVDPAVEPIDIKVFLNFDVWRRRSGPAARAPLWQYSRRLATLRALSRHPRIGNIALVVYSIDEQQVLYRHGPQRSVDFTPMEEAIEKLSPAFVAFEQLGRHKERDFFGDVLLEETQRDEGVDAFVFIGPDFEFGKKLSKEDQQTLGPAAVPVYYLKTNGGPWRGLVGRAVRSMDGDEISIYSPKHLARGVEKLVDEALAN